MPTGIPENIELLNDHESFIIRRTWKSKRSYFMLFFTICWNAFMIGWMCLAFADGIWLMALMGSLHAGVGIYLIYYTTASFLNTTDISINPSYLSITHAPIPWFKPKPLPIESIKMIYSKRHATDSDSGEAITYRVMALSQLGKHHKLVTDLEKEHQANYIQKEIEGVLGIGRLSTNT